ncbi:MAG: tRNA preQ1(34) S-adenosylmethionine ribosyltransferase-isomerase QueA [Synergistetes bacterium]|nr:tRNA preQ1(34) S-adenosylmethionine ribosyltransferase-isomerase QueA [Synergistota bacterium]
MKLSEFDYVLPEELIAQELAYPRDHCRLLVVDRKSSRLEERRFYEIVDYLREGDVMVFNWSKVIPARLFGRKVTGGKMEILLLNERGTGVWEVLVKRAKRLHVGDRISFGDSGFSAQVIKNLGEGRKLLSFSPSERFDDFLQKEGKVPLPPYIRREVGSADDYQTVYAKVPGSVAAPTAGFHFTEELLRRIESVGVKVVFVTLHVGLGTFRPVVMDEIERHRMHAEYFEVTEDVAGLINTAKAETKRIIAVGTTAVRVLETVANGSGQVVASSGWTDIFIYPGYRFKVVDALVTNFHLPKSTLLMLVYAFGGTNLMRDAYDFAIKKRFRFYSFGDAMLII